jgi:hypothetical protein
MIDSELNSMQGILVDMSDMDDFPTRLHSSCKPLRHLDRGITLEPL